MVSEQIEKIKSEYTDKYVIVRAEQPELARFSNYVGQVKTVNMNRRALVQFDDFNQNIGWYDIDLDYLKVVDKPLPKEVPKKGQKPAARQKAGQPAGKRAEKKPAAGEKKLSPLEMARSQGAANKAGAAAKATSDKKAPTEKLAPAEKKATGKLSTADILAAARSGSAKSSVTAENRPAAATETTESKPHAGVTHLQGEGAKGKGGKLSTTDILAAARASSGKSQAPASKPDPEPVATGPMAAAATEAADTPVAVPTDATVGPIDKSGMTPADIYAWCREHDAK